MTLGQRPRASRLDRLCDLCGVVDKHPRHIVIGGVDLIAFRHFDCCHNAGCPGHDHPGAPYKTCGEALERSGQAKGDALVAFLESLMPPEEG